MVTERLNFLRDTMLPCPETSRWQAKLELGFRVRGARTVLAHRRHAGPLQVQRPFYPDGDRACHVYILHPSGGVVGGDTLSVAARVDSAAHALLTTPAAAKLYRSDGVSAQLHNELHVADCAWLEWLPQETIAFDGACVSSTTRVNLVNTAGFIGWEIVCLGRPAAEEVYRRGVFTQRLDIRRNGVPLWWERNTLAGGSPALNSRWGLAGSSVVATMVAVGCAPHALAGLRKLLHAGHLAGEFAVTQLREVLVCRYLGNSAEQARTGFTEAWRLLRPVLWGVEATAPRIWST
ncbi:MAG: urease accessory protein UreD [Acidiferrobacterales bacterium]